MTITRNFKLCLNAGTQNAPYINVNQYDEGEQWIFDLYTEGGQKFTPSTGAIIGIKSDGNAILNSGTVNSDGQVVITETQQMTAASGLAVFELLIEGETHGTANFIVNVERRPSDDAQFSDSDLSMLQEAIDAAEVINEILDEGGDPSEIIAENVNAWLDNHPEATTTVEDGAITAPKLNNSLWDKLLVSEEASGSVASFDDGADGVPVKSLNVSIDPVQSGSGDPSPTNIRPITGHTSANVMRTGKNLFDNTANVDKWLDQSGSIVSGYAGSYVSGRLLSKEGLTYTIAAGNVQAGAFAICFYDGNGQLLQRSAEATVKKLTATAPAGTAYLYAGIYIAPNLNIQLEYGTEPTAYVPFAGSNTYTIDLNGTVYGGTVDLATGVLTVDKAAVDLGTFTWTAQSDAQGQYFRTGLTPQGRVSLTENICTCYAVVPSTNVGDGNIAMGAIGNVMYVRDTRYSDASAFRTGITGQLFVYLLATPQTINLTPTQVKTLLGYNNISSSGTVDVIYHADTKLYIDKRIAELG